MNSAPKTAIPGKTSPMSSSRASRVCSCPRVKRRFWFSSQYLSNGAKSAFAFAFHNFKTAFALVFAAISLLSPYAAMSANGVYLPPPPQGVGGEDSITTATGTHCRSSMNSNRGYVDVGLAGSQGTGLDFYGISTNQRQDNATVYARVVIPLGATPPKIDCTRFMQLELERLEAEVRMLRMAPE